MKALSFKQVNERVVRVNAALTILSLLVFFLTPSKWIVLVLAGDFFIRGFLRQSYSIYSHISKTLLRLLNASPLLVVADSKVFAAKLGFVFCCVLIAAHLFDWPITVMLVGSVFVFFAALEAFFGFCVACKIHPFILKLLNIRKEI